jgi:3',5'-cyclic AMP phosphodiesterase CpdA
VARALTRDLEGLAPDHILTTGDHTGLSLPSEFEAARAALEPLFRMKNVTSIPGNHDVYVASAAREKLYERWFGEWTRTDLQVDDFPAEDRCAFPYPLVRLLGDDVALLCLRDVRPAALYDSSGRVPEKQLRVLERLLGLPEIRRRVKVLALHYGLVRADSSPDTRLHGLVNAPAVRRLASEGGVALVIHGHLHDRFVHPQGSIGPMAIANPGALAYATIGRERITLAARHYVEERDRFEAWPEAPGSGVIWSCPRGGRPRPRENPENAAGPER